VVTEAAFRPWGGLGMAFHITANRFLHHMVRYLMGTMVEIAWGRRPLQDLVELLSEPDTALVTSPPAPAEGLFLTRVHYPDEDSGLD
jgi:tRNA pseudouridine38-40 synthase